MKLIIAMPDLKYGAVFSIIVNLCNNLEDDDLTPILQEFSPVIDKGFEDVLRLLKNEEVVRGG